MPTDVSTDDPRTEAAIEQLARLFARNGYVRRQDPKRRKKEKRRYKKGDEVRLVANNRAELRLIRRLLKQAGFKPGRPFAKARQYRQPVYGRTEVARFLAMVERAGGTAHLLASPRNAGRLQTALARARKGKGKPMTVEELRASVGL